MPNSNFLVQQNNKSFEVERIYRCVAGHRILNVTSRVFEWAREWASEKVIEFVSEWARERATYSDHKHLKIFLIHNCRMPQPAQSPGMYMPAVPADQLRPMFPMLPPQVSCHSIPALNQKLFGCGASFRSGMEHLYNWLHPYITRFCHICLLSLCTYLCS